MPVVPRCDHTKCRYTRQRDYRQRQRPPSLGARQVPDKLMRRDKGLEVVLVNTRHARRPDTADVLAQANVDAGGNSDNKARPATPLPPQEQTRAGDHLVEAQRRSEAPQAPQMQAMTARQGKTALAVDPTSLKLIFQGNTAKLLWQLFRKSGEGMTFADGEEGEGRGARALDGADAGEANERTFCTQQSLTAERARTCTWFWPHASAQPTALARDSCSTAQPVSPTCDRH